MELNISFIIGLAGFILAIINLVRSIIQSKRTKVLVLKLPMKKRIFQKWYDLAGEFIERIEFTEVKKNEGYTIYYYSIKEKNGSNFVESRMQKTLFKRLEETQDEFFTVCGYQKKESTDYGEYKEAPNITSTIGNKDFTFPNDQLPESINAIKNNFLKDIKIVGKENGIRSKKIKIK